MSRMRMMPEQGTEARNVPISVGDGRGEVCDSAQRGGGATEGQVTDVEVFDAGVYQRPDGTGADLIGGRPPCELPFQLLNRNRKKTAQGVERLRISRTV